MQKLLLLFGTFFLAFSLSAQQPYKFTETIDLETTPVLSQGNTGTCWSFSTSSFLESEILRLNGRAIDLSEMYSVRNTYPLKAENFILRQGKAQFSEGGLAHDVMNSVKQNGLVPQQAFSGLSAGQENHNHAELVAVLEAMLKTYIDKPGKQLSPKWKESIAAVLDVYLGKNPESFVFEGKTYTPMAFLEFTKIKPEDYVTLTSFSHVPFYDDFILNIPDNWSNGSFYNLPLNELVSVLNSAFENGYTVELDCDVSEKTFSSKEGVAVVPANPENQTKALQGIYPEMEITQAYRQQEFENYNTTDDHLMHITGLLKDQNGNTYYKVKNSWGSDESRIANGGYVYFSEPYMKLKAISITLHKAALPKETAKKLGL